MSEDERQADNDKRCIASQVIYELYRNDNLSQLLLLVAQAEASIDAIKTRRKKRKEHDGTFGNGE